jgi:hypothetical protein
VRNHSVACGRLHPATLTQRLSSGGLVLLVVLTEIEQCNQAWRIMSIGMRDWAYGSQSESLGISGIFEKDR